MLTDRDLILLVCWGSALTAVLDSASTGVHWPLNFSAFMVVVAGIIHLSKSRDDDFPSARTGRRRGR